MSATGVGVATIDCTSDYKTSTRNFFGNSPFIMMEAFNDSGCEILAYAQAFFASNNCEGSPNLNSTEAAHVIAKLESDGSVVLEYFRDSLCDSSQLFATYSADKDTVATHKCDENWTKWYYIDGDDDFDTNSAASEGENKDTTGNHSDGIKTATIIGILVGIGLVIVLIA
ncbi:TKL protein kinase, partial [Phytophthora palmivora]